MTAINGLFVHLPVADVAASRAFFEALGFPINEQFSNDAAACVVLGTSHYAMLLSPAHWAQFCDQDTCDTGQATEVLIAMGVDDKDQVDALVAAAVAHGGSHAKDRQDHGFMVAWSFYDRDRHHWEVFWMNPDDVPAD